MQPTAGRPDQQATGYETDQTTWQPPLEADPADAQEQTRGMVDDDGDPEAPVTSSAATSDDALSRASEADLAEQLAEVPYDDDYPDQ